MWVDHFTRCGGVARMGEDKSTRKDDTKNASVISFLIESIEVVLQILATLPDDPKVIALRERALEYDETVKRWSKNPPAPDDHDAMMKKILRLHVEAVTVRRSKGA